MLLLAALASDPARAYRPRIYPLASIITVSDWIAAGEASSLDPARERLVITLAKPLKGKAPLPRLTLTARGDPGKELRLRVRRGQRFLLFGSSRSPAQMLGFTEGTWFLSEPSGPEWKVVSLRPEMARTWTGSSAALIRLVGDVLAGKATAPAPNLRTKPALGPVLNKS